MCMYVCLFSAKHMVLLFVKINIYILVDFNSEGCSDEQQGDETRLREGDGVDI